MKTHSKTHCEFATICLRQIHEISRRCETANLCGCQTSQYYMIDLLRYARRIVFRFSSVQHILPYTGIRHMVFTRGSRTLPRSGPVRSGPVRSGPVRSGPVRSGPVRSGPVRSGPVRSGPVRSGPVRSGPVRSGPVRSGPVRSGPVRSGPVRSGPVRSGPVRSGPVRSGPVRSGPVRSSSKPCAEFGKRHTSLAAALEHMYRLTSVPMQRAILTVTNSTTGMEACINESFQFNSQH